MGSYLDLARAVPLVEDPAPASAQPRRASLTEWDGDVARELIRATLRRIGWRWDALRPEQRDPALQEYLIGPALAPIAAARAQRDMLRLRQALADYEREVVSLVEATRAEAGANNRGLYV